MLEQRKKEMCCHENYWLNFVPEKYDQKKTNCKLFLSLKSEPFSYEALNS